MQRLPSTFALVLVTSCGHVAASDLARNEALTLKAVRPSATRVQTHELVTLQLELTASYANPFDSSQIRVDAEVVPPSGGAWQVPGFLYRPFTRQLKGNSEVVEPAGPPAWQVRLSLGEAGPHRVIVSATDRTGTVRSDSIEIVGVQRRAPGFVRISRKDHRYFVTDRGETFFPIGANVCWAHGPGTYQYDRWLRAYAKNGCNYWRAWLSPQWTTFALNTPASGHHGIDLAKAWRLDHAVKRSEELGLRVMLCVDSFNILRSTKRLYGQWEQTPYFRKNGGPCDDVRDYFTNPALLGAYRDRLRYLVGRWGYSTSVMSWEFWNEVDIIDRYDSELVTAWHRDMARFLRSIDPWRHLITTSTARPRGDPRLDALPELEYVQTHHYLGKAEVVPTLREDRRRKAAAKDRPHYHGEFGLFHSGSETVKNDPAGIHLHNALYASVGQEHAGTPMTWWWDSYVDPRNLYPRFGAFARWIEGFDFAAQRPRRVTAEITGGDNAGRPPGGESALRVVGLVGETRGLVWIHCRRYRWDTTAQDNDAQPVTGATLRLRLPAGDWTVAWWDTQAGKPTAASVHEVTPDGTLALPLPPIAWDAALRLRR